MPRIEEDTAEQLDLFIERMTDTGFLVTAVPEDDTVASGYNVDSVAEDDDAVSRRYEWELPEE